MGLVLAFTWRLLTSNLAFGGSRVEKVGRKNTCYAKRASTANDNVVYSFTAALGLFFFELLFYKVGPARFHPTSRECDTPFCGPQPCQAMPLGTQKSTAPFE